MEIFNEVRVNVWRQQPDSFFDEARIDADGTMVETTGECKEGIDINHKGQWGYHPLIASLAGSLKAWAALLVPVQPRCREQHEREKRTLLRMDFATCRNALMNIRAQILEGILRAWRGSPQCGKPKARQL